jgi:arylsulfate sulfotransferase
VVWRWNAYDHLDPFFIGHQTLSNYWPLRGFPNALDWTHANGLYYDQRDDSILLNLRKQSAVLSLDRSSGAIRWILSEPTGWSETLRQLLLEPEGDIGWPWYQHAPSLTPAGTLLLFDNGIWRGRPFTAPAPPSKSHTRAVEYQIDPERGTVREIWASEEPGPDAIVTWAMGDADWLPKTGNVLVYYGNCTEPDDTITSFQAVVERSWTRVREYTHTKPPRLIFEVILRDEVKEDGVIAWMIFGGHRFPSLMP